LLFVSIYSIRGRGEWVLKWGVEWGEKEKNKRVRERERWREREREREREGALLFRKETVIGVKDTLSPIRKTLIDTGQFRERETFRRKRKRGKKGERKRRGEETTSNAPSTGQLLTKPVS